MQDINLDDFLTEDDATDDAIKSSANENQNVESDLVSQYKDFESNESSKTSQRPLASHLVSSL